MSGGRGQIEVGSKISLRCSPGLPRPARRTGRRWPPSRNFGAAPVASWFSSAGSTAQQWDPAQLQFRWAGASTEPPTAAVRVAR